MSRVSRRKRRQRRIKKRFFAAGGGVVLLYLCGMMFFHTHFYPNTFLGDINIGLKSKASAKAYTKEKLSEFSLKVKEKDGEEVISAREAGLSYSNLDSIDKLLADQPYGDWLFRLGKKTRYSGLSVQVDEKMLGEAVDALSCMNPEKPVSSENASIKYSKKKKKYVIKAESIGNIVNRELFLGGVTDAFTTLSESISLEDETYYIKPKYTKDSKKVTEASSKMNKYLKGTVTYHDADMEKKLTKADITEFIKCSDEFKVSIDKEKVRAFVKKAVAGTFNSIQGDIPAGLTAWKVNVDEETSRIIKNIKDGKSSERKPVYSTEGFDREDYDIRKTYIDVNLGDQKMWYVENGEVMLSSDVVTGNLATGHGTATGLYHIAFKQRDHLMVKYNSFVHYWMPYNTTVGIGFHDASWRGSFGGEIYRTNGSHGCINMPPAKAAALYSMISVGTVVYVHW